MTKESNSAGQQAAFSTLPLKAELLSTLNTIGFETMTPIQAQSLPAILDGKDVIGQGKTGSGKTAAFGLGLLNRLDVKRFRIQTLVMCPTRELADQVAVEIRTLARGIHNIKVLTLCGGVPMGPQIGSLEHGAHIVVGTPGRIQDHLEKGRLSLENVNTLVLDEADRMLEMGFQPALDAIIQDIPAGRQTLLFSATFPSQIQAISKQIMNSPLMVKVESTHDNSSISQHFYQCEGNRQRMDALLLLLLNHQPESAVVFCNTKRETKDVAACLENEGFSVVALHGDLEQRDRDQMLLKFANKSVTVMVATDVAARGLDIDSLDAVINYHVAFDTEVHVHRVGRTGRAGSQGAAYTLYGREDGYKIALLEDYLGREIKGEELPDSSVMQALPPEPLMATLHIDGGKKSKVRPGDILGALTGGDDGIQGADVGKIKVTDYRSYVAVKRNVAKKALKKLSAGKIKGRTYRVWQLR
ncbi:ATP-dependent RNA helicase DbpA [Enterovibrio norvegicus]|uniref:ATP-dependent RNA helicase DbpA n=1 Tax=Enterovibrio norvegicus TaxID=188144 RepID=UPI000C8239B6|nr:ATP-dependent RNA helicase DbpA [Enterovibrio norvegicus]PMH61648.1 ATP-dependent RNA helicase DbpA [Enterovibrio norvegicus]TKF31751.1 ATP-dependent RNA helicase DbpA [Enterovibrio norvegicus]